MKAIQPSRVSHKVAPGWLLGVGLTVIVTWAGVTYAVSAALPEWSERAALGDMFGAVNALFSGLAFAGILFTLHFQRQELSVQREELSAQREELKLTREELARTASAQECTHEALTLQLGAMRTTAKLQALSSLIEAYGHKIEKSPQAQHKKTLRANRLKFVDSLENLLSELESNIS